MNIMWLKKLLIIAFITTMLICIGTFFVVTDIQANTYDQYNQWYGQDLDFDAIDDTYIDFESQYESFSSIYIDINLINDQKIYVIESAYDLYMFSHVLNSQDYLSYQSLNYVLGNDINYYDLLVTDSSKTFEPIGFRYPFLGSFDGQGFEITNLYLEPILDSTIYEQKYMGLVYVAMFSHIGTTGIVRNFGLINPIIIQPIEWGAMSYIASVGGLNEGLIEYVYYIDTRENQAGFHAEGAFEISGLVSKNYGILRESFISTPFVKSLAVVQNIETQIILGFNYGIIDHLYYDVSVLSDADINLLNGIGLETHEFQVESYFDSQWYFNNDYQLLTNDEFLKSQFLLKNTYPILQGLKVSEMQLLLDDATDLLFMNELFSQSNVFRSSDYLITHDIDMHQVAYDAYQQAPFGFSGHFSSDIISSESILYNRIDLQNGNPSYYSIIGLNIHYGTAIGRYQSYGFFSSLFGTVEHLNFIDASINPLDAHIDNDQREVMIGLISGVMDEANIYDVHIDLDMNVSDFMNHYEFMSIGSFVGSAKGLIEKVSSTGDIDVALQSNGDNQISYLGAIIGQADQLEISKVINRSQLYGIGYSSAMNQINYMGSMIGYGSIDYADQLINRANLYVNQNGDIPELYVGGIFGYLTDIKDSLSNIYQHSDIIVDMNQQQNLYVNGIGYLKNNDEKTMITSLTHHGHIDLNYNSNLEITGLKNSSLNMSLGITLDGQATLYGIYQTQNQLLDISYINSFSGLITKTDDQEISITKAYQKGNINFTSSQDLTKDNILISGILLGDSYSLEHLRQEGDINIHITNDSDLTSSGKLNVFGVFETLSQDQTAINIYQGGDISITKSEINDLIYDLYVSGIAYKHENTNYYQTHDISYDTIEISNLNGSMDMMLNQGDILISDNFDGDIKASGILLYNYGLLTNAINLGDIHIYNDIETLNDQIEAAGIVYLMVGSYASIKDAANNGDVIVVSNTANGYAHASGIVLRNDQIESGADIQAEGTHQYAKIMFSANYGDIYAYNNNDESNYTIIDETRSKASGILGLGLLSSVNNVNFGNIYSNHLASAMIGFIYLNKFGTIAYDQVYIANSMNYGSVREILAYDSSDLSFSIDINQAPTDLNNNAFGAIVGKIHTQTSTWAFAGDVMYPIDRIYFGYLLNFDQKIDMFSSAPPLSSSWQDVFGGDATVANLAILEMQKYMATTNPDDDSAAPFSYFYAGGLFGQYLGKQISYYDLTTQDSGMFYEDFAFRSIRPVYKGTDQYILDYISYIPRDKINDHMIDILEDGQSVYYPGFYALSSSKGIGNGIFIPDNFETENLNEFSDIYPLGDSSFLGDPELTDTISNQLYVQMRQIKMDLATTIYDLEINQTDILGNQVVDGLTLKDPIIDEQRQLITYYLPSNAAILENQVSTLMNVNSFVEVSEGITNARKVLDIPGSGDPSYTWVGTHKKENDQMIEIGPYHDTGIYNLSSTFEIYESYNRNNPVYTYSTTPYDTLGAVDSIFTHNPNVQTFIIFFTVWYAQGYRTTASAPTQAGYAPYESYSQSNYPTLYRYVGPSQEAVTYVESEVINGVSVFDDAGVYFMANLDETSYQISQQASLTYLDQAQTSLISIPRSYGIYDLMSYQGEYIDSVEDHYGSVRVFSDAYNPADPATYKDYEIRIIRTADESITDILSLSVNDIDALDTIYNVDSVVSNQALNGSSENVMDITYETLNSSDLYYMLKHIEVYHFETLTKVTSSYYRLEYGHVSADQGFNNLDGTWGVGTFDVRFIPLNDFESGHYILRTTLLSGQTYDVEFTKDESSLKSVELLTYQDQTIIPDSNLITSYIDYGLYFDVEFEETYGVDFSNLDDITNIYYLDINENMPSYIEDLEISYFSTIVSVDLSISRLVDLRYQYDVIYTIQAEDLSLNVFTHRLIEKEINLAPIKVYKNGGELEDVVDIDILYAEAPTIRVAYDLSNIFIPHDEVFTFSDSFMPLYDGDQASRSIDYFIDYKDQIGFEVGFSEEISKGDYTFEMHYTQAVTLWGEVLSWDMTFNQIYMHKLRNDQSKIEDILFVSDTIFSGFNTIMDINEITPTTYETYMMHPEQRLINVLPTTGINYHIYENHQAYYIIGQVQKTNLALYEPIFYISDYAILKKVVDENQMDPNLQSDDLTDDFSPRGDDFNFIHYRVYAEDYEDHLDHYTDFYVAVQDVTNNIRFDLTIDNQSSQEISNVYVGIDICASDDICDATTLVYKMGVFSIYDIINETYTHTQFQTTSHGTYQISVNLGKGFSYQIILQEAHIDGTSFYLEDSILPRKYYITIVITDVIEENQWGYSAFLDQKS